MASGERAATDVAIEVRDLWLTLGNATVLEAIDLTLPALDFLGIIGPNGAGKTVLLKVLLGLIEPTRGTVLVFGQPPRQAHGLIGYVPQHAEFDRRFPIRVIDVVRMGQLGPAGAGQRQRDRREAAEAALARVGLADVRTRQIGQLSGGQLQRVLIARALATRPPLLLLDEPTANLDSHAGAQLYEVLSQLAREHTIVLVDHDVGVMHRHVRSVACLNRRLHEHRPAEELTKETLDRTYGYPVDIVVHEHDHGHDADCGHRVLKPHGDDTDGNGDDGDGT